MTRKNLNIYLKSKVGSSNVLKLTEVVPKWDAPTSISKLLFREKEKKISLEIAIKGENTNSLKIIDPK